MTEAKGPKGQQAMVRKASPAGLFFFLVARGIGSTAQALDAGWPRSPARRGFSGNPDDARRDNLTASGVITSRKNGLRILQ